MNGFVVTSKTIVAIAGFISSGRHGAEKAKAAAFFPFIFVRAEKFATPIFINHERIHFRQQLELLFIGVWILSFCEDLYAKLILKLSPKETYLRRAVEQEAYLNQTDLEYLKNRPPFQLLRFINNKKKLEFSPGRAPEVWVIE